MIEFQCDILFNKIFNPPHDEPRQAKRSVGKNRIMTFFDLILDQGFPNWGTCIPRGTFRFLKGYIIM